MCLYQEQLLLNVTPASHCMCVYYVTWGSVYFPQLVYDVKMWTRKSISQVGLASFPNVHMAVLFLAQLYLWLPWCNIIILIGCEFPLTTAFHGWIDKSVVCTFTWYYQGLFPAVFVGGTMVDHLGEGEVVKMWLFGELEWQHVNYHR